MSPWRDTRRGSDAGFALIDNTLTPGSAGHVVARRTGGSTDNFLHYDHIGNVILESNTSGAFAAEHEQDAFGRPVLSDAAGGWSHNSLHQTTKHWDDSTELYYFNARWYDAATGRFISDVSISREEEHPFTISKQDPNIYSDPTGYYVCNHGSSNVYLSQGWSATTPGNWFALPGGCCVSTGFHNSPTDWDFVGLPNGSVVKTPDNAHVDLIELPGLEYFFNITCWPLSRRCGLRCDGTFPCPVLPNPRPRCVVCDYLVPS